MIDNKPLEPQDRRSLRSLIYALRTEIMAGNIRRFDQLFSDEVYEKLDPETFAVILGITPDRLRFYIKNPLKVKLKIGVAMARLFQVHDDLILDMCLHQHKQDQKAFVKEMKKEYKKRGKENRLLKTGQ